MKAVVVIECRLHMLLEIRFEALGQKHGLRLRQIMALHSMHQAAQQRICHGLAEGSLLQGRFISHIGTRDLWGAWLLRRLCILRRRSRGIGPRADLRNQRRAREQKNTSQPKKSQPPGKTFFHDSIPFKLGLTINLASVARCTSSALRPGATSSSTSPCGVTRM